MSVLRSHRVIVGLAVLGMGLSVGLRELVGWDIFWHLLIGKVALASGSTLPVEPFSYSVAGTAWPYKDLVADVLLYLSWDGLGSLGIALLQTGVVALVALGLARMVPPEKRSWPVLLLVIGVAVAAAQARIVPRPVMFTVGLFPVFLALLEQARRRPSIATLVPCVLLAWSWMNLHRAGILAPVLMVGLAAAMALAAGLARVTALRPLVGPSPSWREVGLAAGAAAAAGLLGLLNPSGPALYGTSFHAMESPAIRAYISEWHPLSWQIAVHTAPVAVGLLVLGWIAVLSRLAIAFARRQPSPVHAWHLGVLLVFSWSAVSAVRWLPLASLAAAACLVAIVSPWAIRHEHRYPRGLVALVAVAAVALVFVTNPGNVGLGEARHRYPSGALAFAAEKDLGPRVHNSFVYGGYVLWHGWPAFRDLVDGRHEQVFPADLVLRCFRAQHDAKSFAALIAELPPDWVLADNTPGRESFAFLARDPAWRLVYWSEAAVVYVPTGSRLDRLAFRFLVPADEAPSLARALRWAGKDPARRAAVRGELERILAADPDAVRPNVLMALFFHGTGDRAATDAILQRLDELDPDHPAVRELRAAIRRDRRAAH